MPSINYCLTIWGNASKTSIERIHKLQKRAARIILDAAPYEPSKPLFEKLGWLNVFELVTLHKCILLYKTFYGMSPEYLQDLFVFHSHDSYSLRSEFNYNLRLPKHRTILFTNSIQYSGVNLWNNLPLHIKLSPTLPIFRRNVEKIIISQRM